MSGTRLPIRLRPQHVVLAAALAGGSALAQTAPQAAVAVIPMAADAHPSFAVATIKPHDPTSSRQGFSTDGDRFTIRNETVANLMMFADSLNEHQIVDAPEWVFRDRYDIAGITDTPGEPNLRQMQEMIEKLLADRFGLKFHRGKRELPVYAIVVVKGGPKLKPAADPTAQPDQEGNGRGTEQTVTYTSSTIPDFIMGEQFFMDRPLIDRTGLAGHYDFSIRYTYDEAKSTDPNAPPGLFTAVQEQLGLKFQPTRAPVDVFVIDHVEKPTAN